MLQVPSPVPEGCEPEESPVGPEVVQEPGTEEPEELATSCQGCVPQLESCVHAEALALELDRRW